MKMLFDTKVSGHYRLECISPDGEVTQESEWFDNIITDVGMDALCRSINSGSSYNVLSSVFYHIRVTSASNVSNTDTLRAWVGTGTTPPLESDILLESAIQNSTHNNYGLWSGVSETGGYIWWRCRIEFEPDTISAPISEVGLGPETGILFSRALIPNGPLTVPSGSVLRLTYEMRFNVDMTDKVFNITLDYDDVPTTVEVTLRPIYLAGDDTASTSNNARSTINNNNFGWSLMNSYAHQGTRFYAYPNDIGPRSGVPIGPHSNNPIAAGIVNGINLTQDPREFYSEYRYESNSGANNFPEGIKAVAFHTHFAGSWQVGFNPPLPKSSDNTITFITGSRLSRP